MANNIINNTVLVNRLKNTINEKLTNQFDNDYVLWDLPYHKNIGDTLIWQGTLDFLKTIPYKMIDFGSRNTANFDCVGEKTIICLHGGGNWGDIYRTSQDFRNKVVAEFPNNKIIFFPQSVYYFDEYYLELDKKILNQHKHLTVCVRDNKSYEFVKSHFVAAEIMLVPDMAFCIDLEWLNKFTNSSTNKTLYLNRNDIENTGSEYDNYIEEAECDISDWPTFMKKKYYPTLPISGISAINKKLFFNYLSKPAGNLINLYAIHYLRQKLIKDGTGFLSQYQKVYTTRLHVCILSILLNIDVVVFDNNYGKLSSFYNCWLKECESIKLVVK